MSKVPILDDKLLSINISSQPMFECPKCSKGVVLYADNMFEHIQSPHLYLLKCKYCNSDYQLKLQEIHL